MPRPHRKSDDGILKVPCSHWTDCGVIGGGCCSIGEYERPSFGVCLRVCTAYEGPPRTDAMLAEILASVKSVGCCGDDVKRIKWLGIEWIGVPKPIRWWRWAFTHGHPHPGTDIMWPGCGCISYLYDLRRFWRTWQDRRHWKRRLDRRRLTP